MPITQPFGTGFSNYSKSPADVQNETDVGNEFYGFLCARIPVTALTRA